MGWPSRQDYQEALQAPEIAFVDPELRGAVAVEDRLRLPRAFSGQNATVFEMRAGQRLWAVKCFARELADQQQRYAAISAHLQRARLPYTVGFQFLAHGINIRGAWYPILKMEWVEGDSLKAYVERNLRNAMALRDLADRFLEMVRKLQASGIAHGDLQHGNLLVCGRDLRLVDYDGMFVPSLAGRESAELGHPNYQHPNRGAADFNGTLDNFSAWVIFLSLYALSVVPDLWDSTGRLEESLLFRRKDFETPYASPVIQSLAASKDVTLQQLILRFQVLLYGTPSEAVLPEVRRVAAVASAFEAAGGWMQDHRKVPTSPPAGTPGGGGPPAAPTATSDSSWVLGWIKRPPRLVALRNSVALERMVAISSLGVGAGVILLRDTTAAVNGYVAAYLLTITLGNLVFLKRRYEAEPDVRRLKEMSEQEGFLARQLRVREHTVQTTEKEKSQRAKRGADEVARLRNQETVLRTREMEEVNQLYATRDKRLQDLGNKRLRLDLEEAQELARIRQPVHVKLQTLDQKLTALRAAEADELSKALKNLQVQHVLNRLRSQSIEWASVSGIGPKLKERLLAAGVRTASDIEYHRVMGVERIGPQLASGLVAWRKE